MSSNGSWLAASFAAALLPAAALVVLPRWLAPRNPSRVEALFQSMRDGTYRETGYPGLEWPDIPELLARADSLRTGHLLGRAGFSLSQDDIFFPPPAEGVVALWLVEAIRLRSLWDPSRTSWDASEEERNRYWQPSWFSSLVGEGGREHQDPEACRNLQRRAAQAYRAWWNRVKALAPRDTAPHDPLAGTSLSWR